MVESTRSTHSEWTAILDGSLRPAAQEALQAIATSLRHPPIPSEVFRRSFGWGSSALCDGRAGIALFFAHHWRLTHDEQDLASAMRNLNRALRALQYKVLGSSLFHGFLGIVWTLDHVNGWLVNYDLSEFKDNMYDALRVLLKQPAQPGVVSDLMRGEIGIGLYLLHSLPDARAVELLSLVIDRLELTAQYAHSGAFWLTPAEFVGSEGEQRFPAGLINLGLAHGIPGVVSFLGQVCGADVGFPKAEALLEETVNWLLNQRLDEGRDSAFPGFIVAGTPPLPSRLAWCYGDIGIAVALLSAARYTKRASWEKTAIAVGRRAASRAIDTAGVEDAGLCHGSSGIGHMFNRLCQATGDSIFKTAAQEWFQKTIQFRRPGTGPGGFRAAATDRHGLGRWECFPGFLSGAAGIGLALLSAITELEPIWDRVMLISIPSKAADI